MKQSDNNEMELLLRSLARREGGSSVAQGDANEDQVSSPHLDTDELNSYAERALPALTRARYTAHLADCFACRKTVAQLAMSSGTSIRESIAEQDTSVGFWHRLRALLSPPVVRYAVPALALFAVITVSLVAIRQSSRQPEFVAQNQPLSPTMDQTETRQPAAEAETRPNLDAAVQDKRGEANRNSRVAGADNKAGEKEESAASGSPDADSVTVARQKDAPSEKTVGAVTNPTFAPEPAAAPAPKPQSTSTEANTAEVAKRKETAERDAAGRGQQEREGDRAKAEDRENKLDFSKAPGAAPAGGVSAMRPGQARRSDAKKADDEAETQTVSGRRFRRQGTVWVDTAYQSSMSITNLSRATEQYRGLIADEPGIRAIAEQLSGEVILVWKSRAYRIR